MTQSNTTKPTIRRQRRMARSSQVDVALLPPAGEPEAAIKRATKTDLLLDLLRREQGATLVQLVEATGWLAHTTRAALTGLRKKGHVVISDKVDGLRVYRIASDGDAA